MGDLGKLIVAKGFKKLPKVQNIAQSGHTGWDSELGCSLRVKFLQQNEAPVVDIIKLFWRKSRFPPLAETARIGHFKRNQQFQIIGGLKIAIF